MFEIPTARSNGMDALEANSSLRWRATDRVVALVPPRNRIGAGFGVLQVTHSGDPHWEKAGYNRQNRHDGFWIFKSSEGAIAREGPSREWGSGRDFKQLERKTRRLEVCRDIVRIKGFSRRDSIGREMATKFICKYLQSKQNNRNKSKEVTSNIIG